MSLSKGTADDALLAALRAQNFDDAAVVLDGTAVGGDGVGGVVEENDSVSLGRIGGELLGGGSANPVGNAVLPRRGGRHRGE